MENSLSWMTRAACQGMTAVFFPDAESGGSLSPARRICRECPVLTQCEEYGRGFLDAQEPLYRGLWGGKTPVELEESSSVKPRRQVPEGRGNCASDGCPYNVVQTQGNRQRLYCSVKCKKRAEHKRALERSMTKEAS